MQKKFKLPSPARWLAIGLALVLVFSFAGCSQNTEKAGSQATLTDELLNAVTLPKEYLITYQAESKDGTTLDQVTKGVDADGRIYFKSTEQELLFVPTSGGYLQYQANTYGSFSEADKSVYTQKYVDEATKEFMDYAKKSALQHSGVAKAAGDTQMVGRSCKVYEITMKLAGFSQKYTFTIDKETGACVEWQSASSIGNHALSTDGNFKCVKFQTAGVKLPAST